MTDKRSDKAQRDRIAALQRADRLGIEATGNGRIEVVPANKLRVGDVFSTDGYRVEAAVILSGGGCEPEVAVTVVGEGENAGHQKFAYLLLDHPCPIWRTGEAV